MPTVVRVGMVTLELLFLGGWVGALLVVILSGIDDLHTILQKDTTTTSTAVGGDHELR